MLSLYFFHSLNTKLTVNEVKTTKIQNECRILVLDNTYDKDTGGGGAVIILVWTWHIEQPFIPVNHSTNTLQRQKANMTVVSG